MRYEGGIVVTVQSRGQDICFRIQRNSSYTEISRIFLIYLRAGQDFSIDSTLKLLHQLSAFQFRRAHFACPTFTTSARFCFIIQGLIPAETFKYCQNKNNNSYFLKLTYSSSCAWEKTIFTKSS